MCIDQPSTSHQQQLHISLNTTPRSDLPSPLPSNLSNAKFIRIVNTDGKVILVPLKTNTRLLVPTTSPNVQQPVRPLAEQQRRSSYDVSDLAKKLMIRSGLIQTQPQQPIVVQDLKKPVQPSTRHLSISQPIVGVEPTVTLQPAPIIPVGRIILNFGEILGFNFRFPGFGYFDSININSTR